MKKKFSTSWIGSKQVRKQRKYNYNAPLHLKHKFLNTPLSGDLRKKHGKRSIPLRKDDEVLIMKGSFKSKKGKILNIDLKRNRVTIENINRTKKDGTKINVYFNPSNLRVTSLNLEDNRRLKIKSSNQDKEIKNALEKNTSK